MPRYDDIRAFLAAHGFELYDLSLYRQHPTRHGRSPAITRRVWLEIVPVLVLGVWVGERG